MVLITPRDGSKLAHQVPGLGLAGWLGAVGFTRIALVGVCCSLDYLRHGNGGWLSTKVEKCC